MTHHARSLSFLATLTLVACAQHTPLVAPSAEIQKDTTKVIGVAVLALPEAASYRQFRSDVVKSPDSLPPESQQMLRSTAIDALAKLQTDIAQRLSDQHVVVKIITDKVDSSAFPPVPSTGSKADHDYSSLITTYGIDRLLVLTLPRFGVLRHYAQGPNFMAFQTSQSFGYVRAFGQLIELKTGDLLWSTVSDRTQAIPGEWDIPPSNTAMNDALTVAMRGASKDFLADFDASVSLGARERTVRLTSSSPVRLPRIVPYEEGAASEATQHECTFQTALPQQIQASATKHGISVELSDEDLSHADGRVLLITTTYVYAIGGGNFTGDKTARIRGELRDNGQVIADFQIQKPCRGFCVTACRSLDSLAVSMAGNVVKWLKNPTPGTRIGLDK